MSSVSNKPINRFVNWKVHFKVVFQDSLLLPNRIYNIFPDMVRRNREEQPFIMRRKVSSKITSARLSRMDRLQADTCSYVKNVFSSVLNCELFQIFVFLLTSRFFSSPGEATLSHFILSGFNRPNTRKASSFFAICIQIDRQTLQGRLLQIKS